MENRKNGKRANKVKGNEVRKQHIYVCMFMLYGMICIVMRQDKATKLCVKCRECVAGTEIQTR